MAEIVRDLAALDGRYDAVLCDLWGCLHDGIAPFPSAVAALQAFRARGGAVILVTNAPRPAPLIAAQLDTLGVPRDAWDELVTSGDAAQAGLLAGLVGRRVYHLGPAKDETFFTVMAEHQTGGDIARVGLAEAEGIVCTGLVDDLTETPEDYRPLLLAAKSRGLKLLCANPDIVVDYGHHRLFCAGAIAALYETMGGTSLYFGKPHPPIYDLARRRLEAMGRDVPDDRILAIGDGIATDIAGARSESLDMLAVTGGLAAVETGTPEGGQPDVERLATWLAGTGESPAYAIGQLR